MSFRSQETDWVQCLTDKVVQQKRLEKMQIYQQNYFFWQDSWMGAWAKAEVHFASVSCVHT